MQVGNLFVDALPPVTEERFEPLLSHRNLVIERIISPALYTPHAYRQLQDEWVVLLQGHAVLSVAGETVELGAGDYLFLPAGLPHTVQQVSAGALWLAVHLYPR